MENLTLLSQNRAEYAIVQGDLVHKGWEGEEAPEYAAREWATIDFDRLKLVRWLFSERLQITTGPHAYISSFADLRKKHVWLGRRNGGTYATAWEVLRAAGLTREDLREVGISDYDEANSKLLKGSVDAVFRVTPVPLDQDKALNEEDPNFRSTITYLFHKNDEVRILSLDRPVIERVLQSPSYVEVPIYRGTYPDQKNGALTIGIEAMLVTRLGDSPEEFAKIVNLNHAISDSHGSIQKAMNIELDLLNKRVNPKGNIDEQAIFKRIHAAAIPLLVQQIFWRYVLLALTGLTALALIFLAARNHRVLETLGGNSKYLVTGAFLGAACALFGTLLWFFERRFSFEFMSPIAATESLIVYFAHGMKSESLMTQNGQLVALLALAVIATLVHSLNSDALGEGVSRWSKKLTRWFFKRAANVRPDRRHFVILNWDQRAADKVAEWAKDPGNANSRIIVVSPDVGDFSAALQSSRMEVVHGDPKSMDILDDARVQDAKFVLVCSAWRRADPFDRRGSMDVELADNYTIRAIHGIRMLECRSRDEDPVLIDAEIYLESNWVAAKNAGGPAVVLQPPKGGSTKFASPPDRNSESRSSAQPN